MITIIFNHLQWPLCIHIYIYVMSYEKLGGPAPQLLQPFLPLAPESRQDEPVGNVYRSDGNFTL